MTGILTVNFMPAMTSGSVNENGREKNLPDTQNISLKIREAWRYEETGHDSALIIGKDLIRQCRKLVQDFPGNRNLVIFAGKQMVSSLRCMAQMFRGRGEIFQALDFYCRSADLINALLRHPLIIKDSSETYLAKKNLSVSYNQIAIIYGEHGNYNRALDYFFRSLRIGEATNDPVKTASALTNIGSIYGKQDDHDKAIDYYLRALKVLEPTGEQKGPGVIYGNLGLSYSKTGDHAKGLEYYYRALEIFRKSGNKRWLALNYHNIGNTHLLIAKEHTDEDSARVHLSQAGSYITEALGIRKSMNDPEAIASSQISLGNYYVKERDYRKAFDYYFEGLLAASKSDIPEKIKNVYSDLSDLYSVAPSLPDTPGGKMLNAEMMRVRSLIFFKRAIFFGDSLVNEEKRKDALRKEFNYTLEKREFQLRAEHDRNMAIAEERNQRQRLMFWFAITGLIIAAGFAALMVNRFLVIRGQKKVIARQKSEVEEKNLIIENKNKQISQALQDIRDSAEYASRIQKAVLTGEEYLRKTFPPRVPGNAEKDTDRFFVLYRPRDIVSGDFYWCHRLKNGTIIWAVADCTGHGIPGALMSMIGNTLLNEIVVEKSVSLPAQILWELRNSVMQSLLQGAETGERRDGMDIAICSLTGIGDPNITLEIAAANNTSWITLFSGDIIEVEPDSMPIGFEEGKMDIPFTAKTFHLHHGDMVYLTTDGYIDQFGGPKNKKFTSKRLKTTLSSLRGIPPLKQKEILENTLDEWIGIHEQLDDICVMGVMV
ncbi:MAG: tetratricopeptide repeat protein [Bacteroidetes bacterium]|nr:tetratricopeptide repeat protein [Bacteroidota bacterium]